MRLVKLTKLKIVNFLIASFLPMLPLICHSFDGQSKKALDLSVSTYVANYTDSFATLDSLNIERSNFYFYNSKNELIFSSGDTIYSAYDASVTADADNFFHRKNYRLNFTGILKTASRGEILLLGFDSGVSSNKLKIRPAIKLGYVNTYEPHADFYISYSISKWIGGSISETPCLDAYDRLYTCRNLISWTDRSPLKSKHKISYGFKLTFLY